MSGHSKSVFCLLSRAPVDGPHFRSSRPKQPGDSRRGPPRGKRSGTGALLQPKPIRAPADAPDSESRFALRIGDDLKNLTDGWGSG